MLDAERCSRAISDADRGRPRARPEAREARPGRRLTGYAARASLPTRVRGQAATLAQSVEHPTCNRKVVGSIPMGGSSHERSKSLPVE